MAAQDIVTLKNGDTVMAKVLEIEAGNVRYRMYDEPDGVVYSVSMSEILSIKYESGRVETFQENGDGLFTPSGAAAAAMPVRTVPDVRPGMRYRDYNTMYRASDYVPAPGDKYIPALSGVASFFIPGLGQMICGEIGRGFAFLGMTVGLPVAATLFAVFSNGGYATVTACAAAGVLTFMAVDIWNIVDAVQVAKIKNMYTQDVRRAYAFDLNLSPSVICVPASSGVQASVGLTLALNF